MDSFCSIPLCVGRKACLPPSLAPGSSLASMGPQLCGEPSLGLTTGVSTSRVRLVDALGRQGGAHRLTPRTGSHRARGCLLRPRAARWPAWAAAGPEGPSWCCSLPGCDPPSRGGCPVGPGLRGCPVRAHRWCWLSHLRGSACRRVKGGAPAPEIPPNLVLGCSFVLTFYFVNVVDAIKIQHEETWES